MSKAVLIVGKSGTGKSTSIRNLPPEETFIINVLNKTLPFRGADFTYTPLSKDGLTGNHYAADKHVNIMNILKLINSKRPEIKYLVIDDFGYVMTNDFMRKALIKGYDKFSEMAHDAWDIAQTIGLLRSDLFVFVMMHSDSDDDGKSRPKTIGKMLDEKVCLEGMFTHYLHSICDDGKYFFLTNLHGNYVAKSPMDMFPKVIENDLKIVVEHMNQYYAPQQSQG